MTFADRIELVFKKVLPTPFSIAVLLTLIVLLAAFFIAPDAKAENLLKFWEKGLWDAPLMVFAFQMMLMLVLGHVLALTNTADKLIAQIISLCSNTAQAATWVTFFTLVVSFFNWGLGLIFGAILARKVAEKAQLLNRKLYYPLIGAAGYSGLMVWHGGISGSAPLKVAESGHLEKLLGKTEISGFVLPEQISFSETVFSSMNITISIGLLFILPMIMYFLGKSYQNRSYELPSPHQKKRHLEDGNEAKGAEKIDKSRLISLLFGGFILLTAFFKAVIFPDKLSLDFINPNFINLTLLGLAILLHKNFGEFLIAVEKAIGGASGILIQFPLYFGIMGIMKYSGLAGIVSDFFASHATELTFPIFTFFSAGLVNIFVPSGGGQWGVQGPIIIEAATNLGVPLSKSVMALAYGDQLTNMLQPFWALPLLGITGLKAKEILPFTLILMLVGALIFMIGLLLF